MDRRLGYAFAGLILSLVLVLTASLPASAHGRVNDGHMMRMAAPSIDGVPENVRDVRGDAMRSLAWPAANSAATGMPPIEHQADSAAPTSVIIVAVQRVSETARRAEAAPPTPAAQAFVLAARDPLSQCCPDGNGCCCQGAAMCGMMGCGSALALAASGGVFLDVTSHVFNRIVTSALSSVVVGPGDRPPAA